MAAHIVLPGCIASWARGVSHGLHRNHLQPTSTSSLSASTAAQTRYAAFRSLLHIGIAVKHTTSKMLISPEATA